VLLAYQPNFASFHPVGVLWDFILKERMNRFAQVQELIDAWD